MNEKELRELFCDMQMKGLSPLICFTSDIFCEIRICQVNHQIMFVGKDVAQALGYSNTRDALNKHVDSEDKGTVAIRDTAYETRAVVINESGLYALILSSKLPQAKAFKRWEGFFCLLTPHTRYAIYWQ